MSETKEEPKGVEQILKDTKPLDESDYDVREADNNKFVIHIKLSGTHWMEWYQILATIEKWISENWFLQPYYIGCLQVTGRVLMLKVVSKFPYNMLLTDLEQ